MVHLILTGQLISSSPLFHTEVTGRTLASSYCAGHWSGCLVWTPITHQDITPYWYSCQSSRDSSVSLDIFMEIKRNCPWIDKKTIKIHYLPSIMLFHMLEGLSKHHHLVVCWCLKATYFKQSLKGELWCPVKQLLCCGSEFGSCYTG